MTNAQHLEPLRLDRVSVTYPASSRRARPVEALREVSIVLAPGSVVGLVGVNGAGKTTLLEVCIGALRPTAGSVAWFGEQRWDPGVRRRIGFCPDTPALPPFLAVREVLDFYAGLRGLTREEGGVQVTTALQRLGLASLAGQRVSKLSRGNLVRVGVAQALLGQPDLLLLDESFAPLDPQAQADLRTIIRDEAARGATVLVSSHQLDQLEKVADEILLIHAGQLIRHLSGDELHGLELESLLLEVAAR